MSLHTQPLQKQNQRTTDFRVKYKTQRCRFWYQRGFCPFNKLCTFAHDDMEIRQKKLFNFNYRTKPCLNFCNNGYCKYGERCQYLHTIKTDTKDGQKTRSNSEQSYTSKSSNKQKSCAKNSNQKELKHQLKLQMLQKQGMDYLDIITGSSRLFSNQVMIEQNFAPIVYSNEFQTQFYQCLGVQEDKKQRMYSM